MYVYVNLETGKDRGREIYIYARGTFFKRTYLFLRRFMVISNFFIISEKKRSGLMDTYAIHSPFAYIISLKTLNKVIIVNVSFYD